MKKADLPRGRLSPCCLKVGKGKGRKGVDREEERAKGKVGEKETMKEGVEGEGESGEGKAGKGRR